MVDIHPLYGENIYICIFRQWGGPSHPWCLLGGVCVERGYPSGYLCLPQITTVAFTIMVVSMCIVARGRLTFIIKCTAIGYSCTVFDRLRMCAILPLNFLLRSGRGMLGTLESLAISYR